SSGASPSPPPRPARRSRSAASPTSSPPRSRARCSSAWAPWQASSAPSCATPSRGAKATQTWRRSSPVGRFLAIVPAYNEQEIVAHTVGEILRFAPDFDVLVVDDGSEDSTSITAAAAGARVLRLPFNLGIGGAMQSGYMYALENDYEVAVQ